MTNSNQSPFISATACKKRIKLLLWGSWGVGKTTIALQFPAPVLLDLDGGADLYGDKYQYDVLKSTNIIEIKNAIAWLGSTKTPYQTFILDPITVYWELLKKYWSDVFVKRNSGYKANKHEFYDMGPKEWDTIRADFHRLFDRLNALDMNLVVTAREATRLRREGSEFVSDGVKFDGEKGMPYLFDTIIHLYRESNRHMAVCERDRSETLKENIPFEISYEYLAKSFGLPINNHQKQSQSQESNEQAIGQEKQEKELCNA